tara:strand:- start:6868 stop:7428 length:561 start_codon:yes stop_codon:yes gene_type:complete
MKILIIFFIILLGCQPIEKLEQIVFDNSQLPSFNVLSKNIEINYIYEKKITDPYIGYTLAVSPTDRLESWIKENFNSIGNENIFEINVIESSLIQNEIPNKDAKKFNDKTVYKFEIFFLIEFNLFNNSNNLISSTLVESKRSTTSGLYVSINERERIIDELIFFGLNDIANESNKQLKDFMRDFIL